MTFLADIYINKTLNKDIVDIYHDMLDDNDENISILLINIDRFRKINEVIGRNKADKILNMLYNRISLVSDGYTVLHLFSDNFVVVTNSSHASNSIAKNIVKFYSEPVDVSGVEIYLNLSMGISTSSMNDVIDIADVLINAENALHQSKNTSSNKIHNHNPSDTVPDYDDISLEKEIRNGIKNGEFIVYLQPKVTLSGQVKGAEALIRWDHPEKGILSPAVFIDLAEKSWLISELTRTVIDSTADAVSQLLENDINIRVSFNMSSKVLNGDGDIINYIRGHKGVIKYSNNIDMEIVETSLLSAELTISNLNIIKDMGITISLDDFGTGYSSLSYLSKYPITNIKIDKLFIDDLEDDYGYAITKAIIDMSQGLSLNTVAEGVETSHQVNILRQLGVDEIQGYYFSPPLSLSEFIDKYK